MTRATYTAPAAKRQPEQAETPRQPELAVKRVVTADSFDGQPWPPNDPGLWVVARRLQNNFTLWRQVEIEPAKMTEAST